MLMEAIPEVPKLSSMQVLNLSVLLVASSNETSCKLLCTDWWIFLSDNFLSSDEFFLSSGDLFSSNDLPALILIVLIAPVWILLVLILSAPIPPLTKLQYGYLWMGFWGIVPPAPPPAPPASTPSTPISPLLTRLWHWYLWMGFWGIVFFYS